jgi:hypothetical protein
MREQIMENHRIGRDISVLSDQLEKRPASASYR